MPQINTVAQVGNREDLSDFLVVADAKNTPVTSMMKKGKKPTNVLFSWPVAGIPNADTASIPDGQPVGALSDNSGNRALLSGRVSLLRDAFGVTTLAEDVTTPAGVKSEFKHAKANAIIKLKRSIEAVFCGDQESSQVGTTYTTRGLGKWISNDAQTDLPVQASYRTPAASIVTNSTATLLEGQLLGLMQSIYSQTGKKGKWTCPFGIALKARVSTFTTHDPGVASTTVVRRFNGEQAVLNQGVDIVRGDFGEMDLFPTLWNGFNNTTKAADSNRGYVLEMDDVEMRANELPHFKPLPDDGSGERGYVRAVVALQMGNPLNHGKVVGS